MANRKNRKERFHAYMDGERAKEYGEGRRYNHDKWLMRNFERGFCYEMMRERVKRGMI
jgi:hypothetical protein